MIMDIIHRFYEHTILQLDLGGTLDLNLEKVKTQIPLKYDDSKKNPLTI